MRSGTRLSIMCLSQERRPVLDIDIYMKDACCQDGRTTDPKILPRKANYSNSWVDTNTELSILFAPQSSLWDITWFVRVAVQRWPTYTFVRTSDQAMLGPNSPIGGAATVDYPAVFASFSLGIDWTSLQLTLLVRTTFFLGTVGPSGVPQVCRSRRRISGPCVSAWKRRAWSTMMGEMLKKEKGIVVRNIKGPREMGLCSVSKTKDTGGMNSRYVSPSNSFESRKLPIS